jgi:hypothetical protein
MESIVLGLERRAAREGPAIQFFSGITDSALPAGQSNLKLMTQTAQPQINLAQTPDYRESYANSVQVRVSVWDFQLAFGLASSESPDQVTIRNHHAIYLSPQQAKALWNVLGQNIAQYEQAFGTLSLEPQTHNFPQGPVN